MSDYTNDRDSYELLQNILSNELRQFIDSGQIAPAGENIQMTEEEILLVRTMPDFDLIMLLSEISENGWEKARSLLPFIAENINNKTDN